MNFTITIDASPRLIGLMDLFIGALSGLQNGVSPMTKQPVVSPEPDVLAQQDKSSSQDVPVQQDKSSSQDVPVQQGKGSSPDVPVQQDKGSSPDVPVQQDQPPVAETPIEESNVKPNQAAVIKPEDLRAVAATKDRVKVKELLDKRGCKSLSAVAETDRAEFLAELRRL